MGHVNWIIGVGMTICAVAALWVLSRMGSRHVKWAAAAAWLFTSRRPANRSNW